MNEQLVLRYNPFAGDFGSSGDRTLKNKMVTTRKESECSLCFTTIKKGERVRKQIEIFDGEFEDYCWCNACCRAMEKDEKTGRDDAVEKRIKICRVKHQAKGEV